MAKRWTEQEIDQLIELKEAGSGAAHIARVLKRPLSSVQNMCTKYAPTNRNWTEEEDDLLRTAKTYTETRYLLLKRSHAARIKRWYMINGIEG